MPPDPAAEDVSFGQPEPLTDVGVEHPRFSEFSMLWSVAAGEARFDAAQREWALTEGVELSGYRLMQTQLADGGDRHLAARVLGLARQNEFVPGARRLTSMVKPAPARPVVAEDLSRDREPLSPADWAEVAAGRRALRPLQRELAICDAIVRSEGAHDGDSLAEMSDSALADLLLSLPTICPLTGNLLAPPDRALAA